MYDVQHFFAAPIPEEEPISNDFALKVNGQSVPVYTARVSAVPFNQVWPGYERPIDQTELASFATFDFSGSAQITVELLSQSPEEVAVRPKEYDIRPEVSGRSVSFSLSQPLQFTLEINGFHHALHLFANPMEDFCQYQGKPGVHYYGPGIHKAGLIRLQSNETLVLDHGAVVHGGVIAENGEHIRILGRGILDSSLYPRVELLPEEQRKQAVNGCIRLLHCKDVTITGIILRDSNAWTITPIDCNRLLFENLKLIGMWRYNSDGIDLCNCQDAEIRHCFLRTFDDGVVLKGLPYMGKDSQGQLRLGESDLARCKVTDCVFWCDWGRAIEIGVETYCDHMEDVLFSHCHIIRTAHVALDIQNGHRARIERVRFEDISFEVDPHPLPCILQTAPGQQYPGKPGQGSPQLFAAYVFLWEPQPIGERGSIRQVTVKNVRVYGGPHPDSQLYGYDSAHRVENLTFENISFNQQKAGNLEQLQCQIGAHCDGISIL